MAETPRHRAARPGLASAVSLLVFAVLTGCSGPAGTDTEERVFGPVGQRLTVSAGSGDLDIRPTDTDRIRVTRHLSAWSLIGADTEATWKLSGGTLTLALDCGPVVLGRCDARYEVLVPREVRLVVEGGSGQIAADGFTTPLRITSENGGVRVDDVSGPLTLATTSGGLRGTGITSSRTTADSENGKIDLSFAEAPEQVEATAENGAVALELPEAAYAVTTTTDSGAVDSDLSEDPDSPHAISATTDNGAIELRTAD